MPCYVHGLEWLSPAHLATLRAPSTRSNPRLPDLCCTAGSSLSLCKEESVGEEWRRPQEWLAGRPPVVALGKFDALHIGHRSLVAQAASMGGSPCMLSFSGMAEVLGWPTRPPLVAEIDRPRVLESWAPHCQGLIPRQRMLPFAAVRNMSPAEFVALLADHLKVAGIVVGKGYRFGYKQAGDTDVLEELGRAAGLQVCVSELVGAGVPGIVGKVSSSAVRRALSEGRMGRVRRCLGRDYRLVACVDCLLLQETLRLSYSSFMNQVPGKMQCTARVGISCQSGSACALEDCSVAIEEDVVTITHKNVQHACSPETRVTLTIDFCTSEEHSLA